MAYIIQFRIGVLKSKTYSYDYTDAVGKFHTYNAYHAMNESGDVYNGQGDSGGICYYVSGSNYYPIGISNAILNKFIITSYSNNKCAKDLIFTDIYSMYSKGFIMVK